MASLGGLQDAIARHAGEGFTRTCIPRLALMRRDRIISTSASVYAAWLLVVAQGRVLPPTAQVAHQQARHLIRTLPSILAGKRAPDFRYRDFGALVSLGDYDAFGSLGQFGFFKGGTIRGRLAQFSHTLLYRSHQARLHGFWRGGLRWWVDRLNARLRAPIRLD